MTVVELINKKLGHPGRIISMSKSSYRDANPNNVAIFNANIVIDDSREPSGSPEYVKVWYGDIDVTKDRSVLDEIAEVSGSELFILMEMDGRFEREDRPNIDNYVFKTNGTMAVGPKHAKYYECANGIVSKIN